MMEIRIAKYIEMVKEAQELKIGREKLVKEIKMLKFRNLELESKLCSQLGVNKALSFKLNHSLNMVEEV